MQVRYYFSGFDESKGFPKELIKFLKQDIIRTSKLLFIPSNIALKEKIERHSKSIINMFKNAGFIFDNIVVLNENMTSEEMKNYIENSDVIFLMGGNPNIQLNLINSNELDSSIRNTKAVVMGTSAGAMCMSKYSLILPVSEEYPTMDIRQAMNLSGISIYPHYNSNGEVLEVLDDGEEKTKKEDLLYANKSFGAFYLIPDNSEIREKDGELTFIGNNIILVSNGNFQLIVDIQ